MKHTLNPIFLILMICSCQHSNLGVDNNSNLSGQSKSTPKISTEDQEWVNDNGQSTVYCSSSNYLCAVGQGATIAMASAKARVELAKIFETKISETTTMKSATTQNQLEMTQPPKGSKWENLQKEVKEEAGMDLEGVEIKLTTHVKNSYYALAVLDKNQAKDRLKEKMNKIDESIESNYKKDSFIAYLQLKRNFLKRSYLNNHYQIVSGQFYKEKWTKDHLAEKEKCCSRPISLKLNFNQESSSEELKGFVSQSFSDLGFELTSQESESRYKVEVKWLVKDLYIKVQGFQKYEFSLELNAKDAQSGKIVEALQMGSVQTGRDLEQAQEKAYNEIKSQLYSKLEVWDFKK